jgi:hypothetical protein
MELEDGVHRNVLTLQIGDVETGLWHAVPTIAEGSAEDLPPGQEPVPEEPPVVDNTLPETPPDETDPPTGEFEPGHPANRPPGAGGPIPGRPGLPGLTPDPLP